MSLFVPSRGVAQDYVVAERSVPLARRFLPTAQALGAGISAGRVGIGVVLLAAPVGSVRVLGTDTATAKRVTHLIRMAAIRDVVLGAGAASAQRRGEPSAGWVVAGAAADVADAVLVAGAIRKGRARGLAAGAAVVGALASATAGGWAAAQLARRH